MELRTQGQNKSMHYYMNVLIKAECANSKDDIIWRYFKEHKSTASLTIQEAEGFIKWLKKQWHISSDTMDRMRKKIIAIVKWEMGWSMADIDKFCTTKGKFKKKFNEHTYKELPQLVSQFEQIYKKKFKKVKL